MSLRLFIACLFLPFFAFSQGEANYWYFGNNAGLNFNTSPPSSLSNGALSTSEGCSTISDESGNLLFYTDGRTVWNRNHQIMSNADYFGGSGLLGDPSSTSSGLIVPHPTNRDLYYVFTVDEPHHDNAAAYPNQGPGTANGQYTDLPNSSVPQDDDGYNNGLNYSLVDMTLDGGLGNVVATEKNVHLVTYNPNDSEEIKYQVSEKITAVKGSDCNSIWVVTHFIDEFYAFKIDENGVEETPVITQIGPEIPIDSYRRAAIGYMKISPNGKKLIIAHNTRTYNQVGNSDAEDGGVFLYDFNDETGQISNQTILVENINAYGVEFSMETKKAYATVTKGVNLRLYQWDLEAEDIANSMVQISGTTGGQATALQLAPNGKIYKTLINQNKLAVINNPELDGNAVDYSESLAGGALPLSNVSLFGLPPFIQSFFASRVNIIDDTTEEIVTELNLCDGENFTLQYSENIPGATYTWYKNETEIIGENNFTLNVSQESNQTLPQTTTYKLVINPNDGSCPLKGIANVTFHPYPPAESLEVVQCDLYGLDQAVFNLETIKSELTNNDSTLEITYFEAMAYAETNQNAIEDIQAYENYENPQQIFTRVKNTATGCTSFGEITLKVNNLALEVIKLRQCPTNENGLEEFDLNEATNILQETDSTFQVNYYLTEEEAYFEENPISSISNFQNTTAFSQSIFARVSSDGGCEDIVEIQLEVENTIPIGDDKQLYYCQENFPQSIELSSGIPSSEINNYTFLWSSDNSTSQSINVNTAGEYTVTATHKTSGCYASRTFKIIESNQAEFSVNIKDFRENKNEIKIVLSENNLGDYEFSLDNEFGTYQESPIFKNLPAGEYTVYVKDKNGCGISAKEIVILGAMQFFTPNQDGYNDRWGIIGRSKTNLRATKIYIFDRYGKLLKNFGGNFEGWDGTYNGKNMPSNDYWYKIILENGRTVKGNFSLIR